MNLSRLDLNLLLVFTSIYNEKTITKAAEKLNLSQSAVSNALNRLRYTLDDDLFFRSSDMMKPTKRAEDLAFPIQNALDQIQESLSSEEFYLSLQKFLRRRRQKSRLLLFLHLRVI
jgi:DNA-binding transcriptional LysR family regulator